MGSEDTGAFLLYLGNKYKLSLDKTHLLSKIVGNIILGIMPMAGLASEIANKIAIDQNIASQIAQEINSELFTPVANFLKGAPTPITTPAAGPEIIDLRKTPPPPMPTPTFRVGAPTPPLAGVGVLPVSPAPIPPRPAPPLPAPDRIEPPKTIPLIEAEPHKKEFAADKYREQIDVLDLRQDKGEF